MNGDNLTVGSIVVGRIDHVNEYGMFVSLMEYKKRTGFVPIAEISQRKRSSVLKHNPIGSICAFHVLVVSDKGVDLSRKNMDADEASSKISAYISSCSTSQN